MTQKEKILIEAAIEILSDGEIENNKDNKYVAQYLKTAKTMEDMGMGGDSYREYFISALKSKMYLDHITSWKYQSPDPYPEEEN